MPQQRHHYKKLLDSFCEGKSDMKLKAKTYLWPGSHIPPETVRGYHSWEDTRVASPHVVPVLTSGTSTAAETNSYLAQPSHSYIPRKHSFGGGNTFLKTYQVLLYLVCISETVEVIWHTLLKLQRSLKNSSLASSSNWYHATQKLEQREEPTELCTEKQSPCSVLAIELCQKSLWRAPSHCTPHFQTSQQTQERCKQCKISP